MIITTGRGLICLWLLFAVNLSPLIAQSHEDDAFADERTIKAIFNTALSNGDTYALLDYLCNRIGPRLSGSENAALAVQWSRQVMENLKFDRVFLQSVMVPHWERGEAETVTMVSSKGDQTVLNALALGGSDPTPESGVKAAVVVVEYLEDLEALGRGKIDGRIVFFNRSFDQTVIHTGTGYGSAVDQRTEGASEAAKYGAVGVVIRSVTSGFDDQPHTGSVDYVASQPRIPAAALGFQSADQLAQALLDDPALQLKMTINSRWLPDAPSHNVIGEIRGSVHPERIILVGGHLDSWDVGQGAHDDGAGSMHAIMAVQTLRDIGYTPRHTLRAVMFMNEENGLRGGQKYAELAMANGEDHLVLIESDAGGFSPRGFGVTMPDTSLQKIHAWLDFFPQKTISFFSKGGGGADIKPLHEAAGTPMIGFMPDSQRMFNVHHSPNDVFASVNRRELELGTASIAALIYLIDRYGL